MADSKPEEDLSYREKLRLIWWKKGLLAAITIVFTVLLTAGSAVVSDRLKTVWSTAVEKMFDDRMRAYSELLQRADGAVATVALEIGAPSDPADPLAFDVVSATIKTVVKKFCAVYPQSCSGGGGGDIGWDLMAAFDNLDKTRQRYRLLIPNDLNKYVSELVEAMAQVINAHFTAVQRSRDDKAAEEVPSGAFSGNADVRKGWIKVLQTHRQLTDKLRRTLGLEAGG
jgi:hypothetical protein